LSLVQGQGPVAGGAFSALCNFLHSPTVVAVPTLRLNWPLDGRNEPRRWSVEGFRNEGFVEVAVVEYPEATRRPPPC
jgi:hypothetical protein